MMLRSATPYEHQWLQGFSNGSPTRRTDTGHTCPHSAQTGCSVPNGTLVTYPRDESDGAADGWWRWGPLFESAREPMNAALVELADLRPGQRVLDEATGCDEPVASAARRVGPAGSLVVADAEDRGLVDARFDAVLCRFGLSFVPNVTTALQRLAVLFVPGGRLAAAAWGSARVKCERPWSESLEPGRPRRQVVPGGRGRGGRGKAPKHNVRGALMREEQP